MKQLTHPLPTQVTTWLLRLALLTISVIVLALCAFALPSMWRAVPEEFPDHTYVFYGILSSFYIAAVPFFVALWQANRLLGFIDKNHAFSKSSVKSLKIIAYCGLSISVIFTAVMPLIYIWADIDDAPGLILFWSALIGASFTVSVFAGVMERVLKQAIALKSENDLTV